MNVRCCRWTGGPVGGGGLYGVGLRVSGGSDEHGIMPGLSRLAALLLGAALVFVEAAAGRRPRRRATCRR